MGIENILELAFFFAATSPAREVAYLITKFYIFFQCYNATSLTGDVAGKKEKYKILLRAEILRLLSICTIKLL